MTSEQIEQFSTIADSAARELREIEQLTDIEQFSVQEAYAVQRASMAKRLSRGERIVGMKMGLTSRAKMQQMGVEDPIYGTLTDTMIVESGAAILMNRLIHPRIEPEIAFLMKEDLHGPVTASQALAAVGGACVALEVIDSRFKDFKFTLPDVIADNTSAAFVVLGRMVALPDDMSNLGIVMDINGVAVETASSAAVLEHPANSLAALANMLARDGDYVRAGHVVLTGGATAAVAVGAGGVVRGVVEGIGDAWVRFV